VLKILQKEKTKRDEELRTKLKAALDFKQANPSLSFEDSKGNVIVQRLARLFEALTTAQFETLDAKANYEAIKATADDPEKVRYLVAAQRAKGVFVSTESEEARLRADLENLEQRLAALKQQFTDEALAVRLLKSEIEGRRNRLDAINREFAEGNVAVAEQQYLKAKEKEDQLAQYVEEQRKEAVDLTSQLAGYALLESDWTRTQKLCDIIDDRIKELNVTEDAGALNISILEVAKAEDKPTSPQPSRVMAIALVIGLMLGAGWHSSGSTPTSACVPRKRSQPSWGCPSWEWCPPCRARTILPSRTGWPSRRSPEATPQRPTARSGRPCTSASRTVRPKSCW